MNTEEEAQRLEETVNKLIDRRLVAIEVAMEKRWQTRMDEQDYTIAELERRVRALEEALKLR